MSKVVIIEDKLSAPTLYLERMVRARIDIEAIMLFKDSSAAFREELKDFYEAYEKLGLIDKIHNLNSWDFDARLTEKWESGAVLIFDYDLGDNIIADCDRINIRFINNMKKPLERVYVYSKAADSEDLARLRKQFGNQIIIETDYAKGDATNLRYENSKKFMEDIKKNV